MMRLAKLFACLLVATLFYVAPAHAQATRTWVSGVGDDVNPCSRTAPCKTFAGAISKTAAGGEIDCLDPGGFGTVTITKSITIDCRGTLGSILASSTNGININDSASGFPNSIHVVLRGLSINGAGGGAQNAQGNPGTGLVGINFTSGASLVVEDVVIQNFNAGTAAGIRFAPGGSAELFAHNSVIVDNGLNASTGGGILVQPTGTGNARVTLSHVTLSNNAGFGFKIDTTGTTGVGENASISNTNIAGTAGTAVQVVQPFGAAPAQLNIIDSQMFNNPGVAIVGNGVGVSIRVAGSAITGNGTGLQTANGALIKSWGNNDVDGNAINGAFNLPNIPQF